LDVIDLSNERPPMTSWVDNAMVARSYPTLPA
jgi:hypothetical protein